MKLKRLLLAALIYALPTAAFAQCSGIFTSGNVCGNNTASGGIAASATLNSILARITAPVAFGGGGGITINPTAATLNKGINITQTGPASGSVVGPTSFNLINATYHSTTTGSTDPFFDNGAWQQWVAAWRVNFEFGGPNIGGQPIGAGFYQLANNTATPFAADMIGLAAEAYSNANSPNAWFHGLVGAPIMGPSAVIAGMVGVFSENDIRAGAVVGQRRGFHSVNQGFATSTHAILDNAYDVASGDIGGSFKNLMVLDGTGGAQPLQLNANLFIATSAMTIANVFNLPTMTVTGDILNFSTVKLSAAGTSSWPIVAGGAAAGSTLTLESTTGTGTTDSILFKTGSQVQRGAINTSGQWTIGPNFSPAASVKLTVNKNAAAPASNSGAGQAVTQIVAADGENNINIWDTFSTGSSTFLTLRRARGTGAAFTAAQSGDSLGFLGMIGATAANTFGSEAGGAGGAFIGGIATENWSSTAQGTKLNFYTTPNTTAAVGVAAVLSNAGGLTVGASTEMPTGVIDANVGFRVANAAVSGNVLRGNGTNFVSAQLSFSDLATGTAPAFGSGAHTITSASATALTVGLNGATNPAFTVDSSTGSQAAGLKITGAATGGTVALVATDSGSNTNVTLNAKGSGTIGIGSVSTGAVTITPALTLSAALTYGGVTLSNSVVGTGSMVLATAPTGFIKVVKVQKFTASGTYTPSTGIIYAIIECVGGGAGGGGVTGTAAQFYVAGGGGSGSYSRAYASAAAIGASQTVTIGAAGAGGSAGSNAGSVGSDTSVGSICIGKGGSGGNFSSAIQNGIGGAGGVAGTGDFTPTGAPGAGGFYNAVSATIGTPAGLGGSSIFGGGATATTSHAAGVAASNYGSGGSGASSDNGSNFAGGNGSAGVVVVTEFTNQ